VKIQRTQLNDLIKEELVRRNAARKAGKAVKTTIALDEAQLRRLIEAELTQVGGNLAAAGGSVGSLKKLKDHLNGAKQALSDMYQSSSSRKASDQAQALLTGINRIVQALDTMPELTAGKATPAAPMALKRR
jgi:hypothetical protein